MAIENSVETVPALSAEAAQEIANGFLVEEVGDLLRAGEPQLTGTRWVMPIIAGNVVQGELGLVGMIRVDALSGRVLFSDEDRADVSAGARLLAAHTSP